MIYHGNFFVFIFFPWQKWTFFANQKRFIIYFGWWHGEPIPRTQPTLLEELNQQLCRCTAEHKDDTTADGQIWRDVTDTTDEKYKRVFRDLFFVKEGKGETEGGNSAFLSLSNVSRPCPLLVTTQWYNPSTVDLFTIITHPCTQLSTGTGSCPRRGTTKWKKRHWGCEVSSVIQTPSDKERQDPVLNHVPVEVDQMFYDKLNICCHRHSRSSSPLSAGRAKGGVTLYFK